MNAPHPELSHPPQPLLPRISIGGRIPVTSFPPLNYSYSETSTYIQKHTTYRIPSISVENRYEPAGRLPSIRSLLSQSSSLPSPIVLPPPFTSSTSYPPHQSPGIEQPSPRHRCNSIPCEYNCPPTPSYYSAAPYPSQMQSYPYYRRQSLLSPTSLTPASFPISSSYTSIASLTPSGSSASASIDGDIRRSSIVTHYMEDKIIDHRRIQRSRKKRANLPKKTTSILLGWLNDNLDHPYPSATEKSELIRLTGLTNQQLSNWFINARRRKIQVLRALKEEKNR